ncbi:MAG TPA: hypothetical protein VK901_18000, partial [Nitrospiraceae bacterium]|nr:hypothetical protein [Nitrospiraceae bacterium]
AGAPAQFRAHSSDATHHSAMAAGVTKRLCEIGDAVDVLETPEARVSKKGRPALTTRALYRLPTARDVNATPSGFGGYCL